MGGERQRERQRERERERQRETEFFNLEQLFLSGR